MLNSYLRRRVVYVNPKIFPSQQEAIEEQRIAMESFNSEMSMEAREISDRIRKRSEDLLNKFDSSQNYFKLAGSQRVSINQEIECEDREKRIKKQQELILNKIKRRRLTQKISKNYFAQKKKLMA